MNKKIFSVAAVALMLGTGAAMAQTSSGEAGMQDDKNAQAQAPSYASDNEKMMYQNNKEMMAPFFTDDSMTTLKSDDEVKSAFEAMGAENQSQMKSACEHAMSDRGSYGTVTAGLCQQVGAM